MCVCVCRTVTLRCCALLLVADAFKEVLEVELSDPCLLAARLLASLLYAMRCATAAMHAGAVTTRVG
jgi:hypothetical protein